jgi:hypothetical protein
MDSADILSEKVKTVAERLRLGLKMDPHPWPTPRYPETASSIVTQQPTLDYLDGNEYDGDISFCLIPTLEDADAVVGSLLTRSRKHIICLYTIKDLPDTRQEANSHLYKTLLTIPTDTTTTENGWIEPYGPSETKVWDHTKNPMLKGRLHIRPMGELTTAYVQNLLESVKIEKYGM